ncbi:MAG: exodeoxyribonuclease VII large subunit [Chloroflexi bacterium]|nr:exodeoxyribonuclease VII large subunit [Chloroflexota bacterium]
MTETYTVWELTTYIRDLLDLDPKLQQVWVEGELSNLTRASSGHWYFTLKDDRSELKCVMWKAAAAALNYNPQHGDRVLARGRVAVYEARGQYQLMCDQMQPAGVGDLNRQFELLKIKLEAEGLFDTDRKRPIPAFPHQIGVVTSPTTAAFQDIQNVLRRRYPLVEVILSPTLVQGKEAPPQIVEAIRRLNDYTQVDVILLARGGGSLEDLWCFNDETVVRAVAGSRLPVITGVGHEIDFTLVDFAADYRAPTPSAAAEILTPDGEALRNTIEIWRDQMAESIQACLDDQRQGIAQQTRWLGRLSPAHNIQTSRQRIDDLLSRAARSIENDLARQRERLASQTRALESASPLALLQRGYALVTRAGDGRRVSSVNDAAEGTLLHITLHDGRLTASVQKREKREP